jgi:hypothetical protein
VWLIVQDNPLMQRCLSVTAALNKKDHKTGLRVTLELFVCINSLNILLWLNLINSLSGYLGTVLLMA